MGIKNLSKLLVTEHTKIEKFANAKVAIDASIFLYSYSYNSNLNGALSKFFHQLSMFKIHNITPVYVFDGEPHQMKEKLLKVRREKKYKMKEKLNGLEENTKDYNNVKKNIINIDKSLKPSLKEILEGFSILYLEIDGYDAEKICSELYIQKYVDYVMTNDNDCLVYGTGKMLSCLNFKGEVNYTNLENNLENLKINKEQFLDLSIILGTDFNTSGFYKMGTVNGLKCVQNGTSLSEIAKNRNILNYEEQLINDIKQIFNEPYCFTIENLSEKISFKECDEDIISNFVSKYNIMLTKNYLKTLTKQIDFFE
jgi:flap endonuclease-1